MDRIAREQRRQRVGGRGGERQAPARVLDHDALPIGPDRDRLLRPERDLAAGAQPLQSLRLRERSGRSWQRAARERRAITGAMSDAETVWICSASAATVAASVGSQLGGIADVDAER